MRLANLRSGQLDFIERMQASDVPQLKTDSRFKIAKSTEIGYQGITINVGKSDLSQKNPLGRDAKVREAFELSLDRDGIVQVGMDGEADIGNQWVAPGNAYYAKNVPIPKRDIARAKELLREAGVTNPTFTLVTPTTSDGQKIAQVVQAMAREAGFEVKLQATEFATSLDMADKGQFEAYVLAWSGRADPGRQPVQLRRMQAAAQLRRLLQIRGRRAVESLAHDARSGRAEESIRTDRRDRAQGPPGRLPVPSPLAVGAHRQALRTAHDSRRSGADSGVADELGVGVLNYLVQRLATLVPTLFFVSILIFGLQQLLPGDPALILAGEDQDPTVIAHLHEKLHLDKPLPIRYLYWAGGVLKGDLGESVRIQKPVRELIFEKPR